MPCRFVLQYARLDVDVAAAPQGRLRQICGTQACDRLCQLTVTPHQPQQQLPNAADRPHGCTASDQHKLLLQAADNLLYTREAIAGVAAQHGLAASFLPKVIPGQSSSACHCHISMWKVSSLAKACLHARCLTSNTLGWTASHESQQCSMHAIMVGVWLSDLVNPDSVPALCTAVAELSSCTAPLAAGSS